jgi:hypothetical protein
MLSNLIFIMESLCTIFEWKWLTVLAGMLTIYIYSYPSTPIVRDSEFGVLQLLGVLIY